MAAIHKFGSKLTVENDDDDHDDDDADDAHANDTVVR